MRARDEPNGRPGIRVKGLHAMAPIRADATVDCWINEASTIPPPIILATAVDMKAPAIFKMAASSTARPGVRTWVETTVAIALALSCQPFEKSNARARITTRTKRRVGSIMAGREV